MKQLDQDIWIADLPLRVAGVLLGARMTVVRVAGGGLFVHSPIKPTDELLDEVRSLGTVSALVAPNRVHHLFAKPWLDACPGALLYAAPGLDTKRPDLPITGILSDEPEAAWRGSVEQVAIRGLPFSNEIVFYHPSSKTLIATDLAFNVGPHHPLLTRIFFRFSGAYGSLSPSILERLLLKDRAAFRTSIERVLSWPFERVIVAHGDVKETGGRQELEHGYSWLLR